ncbi:MAG: hypothetical protein PCALPYG88_7037 [uncultured Paraburkholderia sp.]|nr:MAG: hypothetical protein PCALPYG08_6867 [uncultured Paraburkholderia sp.]CAH2941700.1 MAG: hypothetical protein PCALPYG88_7037 [uncultured Paraburkholderia sp.]
MRPSSMTPRKQLALSLEREEQVLLLPAPAREKLIQAVADLLLEALGTSVENVDQAREVGDEF